jgi:Gpi18-like mannosyltransferase
MLLDAVALLLLLAAGLSLAWWSYGAPRSAALAMDAPAVLLPLNGFHEVERFADRPGAYRWARGNAAVALPNPGGAAVLRVVMAGGPGRTVPVQVRAAGATIALTVQPEPRTYTIALPAAGGERVTVAFDSPTIQQSNRELGVVVGDLAIAGGGAAPTRVLLALAVATVGLYVLFRRAALTSNTLPVAMGTGAGSQSPRSLGAAGERGRGGEGLLAAGAVLLFQFLVVAWQFAGLWSYALLGTLLLLVGAASLAAVAIERVWPPIAFPERPRARLARRDWLVVAALLAGALLIRLPFLAAPDPVGDLELSARRMGFLYADGLAGAYRFDGDYMPLRLYWLLGFSRLVPLLGGAFADPLPPPTLILIKLPGLLADLATVALIYAWSRRWLAVGGAALIGALYTFAPPVWMVVAWWGQVDAILLLPLLGMVALLDRAGGRWSWACWAVALLIKTQAIIFAPLLYVATLRRHGCRGLAGGGALAAALLAAGCAPLILAGQGAGLAQAYVGAVGRFPQVTNRAYNLWWLVTGGASRSDLDALLGPLSHRSAGLALVGGVALLVCLALLRRADGPARAEGAAVTALAFFLLPTQIHERYLFFALAFLAMRAASDRRLLAPYLILVTTATLNILGTLSGFSQAATAAIAPSPLPFAIAVVNLLALVFLIGHLLITSRSAGASAAAPEGQQAVRAADA